MTKSEHADKSRKSVLFVAVLQREKRAFLKDVTLVARLYGPISVLSGSLSLLSHLKIPETASETFFEDKATAWPTANGEEIFLRLFHLGKQMTQKIVHRLVMSAALLALGAAMGVASAAEVQQTATYQVQKADGQVKKIVVVTEDDGSFVVLVDGVKVEGAQAVQVLADNGIALTVSANGEIQTTSVAKSVQVVVAPKAATAADAQAVEATPAAEAPAAQAQMPAAAASVMPSLPSNTMAGSGLAISGAAQGTQDQAIGAPEVKPQDPVSR